MYLDATFSNDVQTSFGNKWHIGNRKSNNLFLIHNFFTSNFVQIIASFTAHIISRRFPIAIAKFSFEINVIQHFFLVRITASHRSFALSKACCPKNSFSYFISISTNVVHVTIHALSHDQFLSLPHSIVCFDGRRLVARFRAD